MWHSQEKTTTTTNFTIDSNKLKTIQVSINSRLEGKYNHMMEFYTAVKMNWN